MIGFTFDIIDNLADVQTAADKAAFRNFGHAAAAIRKTAIASIQPGNGEPSPPGSPPHTQTATTTKKGKPKAGVLPRSIAYDATKVGAVIGPRFSIVGDAGAAHEHGGDFRGDDYPARPFMRPALNENLERFAAEWAGSIGE